MAKYRQADIPQFSSIRTAFERSLKHAASEELSKFASSMKKELVGGIKSQKFLSFAENPLSPAYKHRKLFKGLDPRVLVATGHYVNSIKVIRHGRLKFEINVPENAKAVDENGRETEMSLRTLGAIHEYGSAAASVPPRAHWRIVIQKAETLAPKVGQKIAEKTAKSFASLYPRKKP